MGRLTRMEENPKNDDFSHIKLHVSRFSLGFMKLHELQLAFVPFPQELRTTYVMSNLSL
jgi:hypothetical protein